MKIKYLFPIFIFVSAFALAEEKVLFYDDGEDVWGYPGTPPSG